MNVALATCFLGTPCTLTLPGICYAKKLHKGEHLHHAGDDFRSVFQVVRGSFKTLSASSQGVEQVLGFYFPGEFMGLDAISDGMYPSTAIALEDSEICAIYYSAINELCVANRDMQNNVHIAMSTEIRRKAGVTTLLAYASIEERVATFILDLLARTDAEEQDFLPLPMRRHEIASYLGMSGETLSRQFAKFARLGVILGDVQGVHVLNRVALESLRSSVAENCFGIQCGDKHGSYRKQVASRLTAYKSSPLQ